MIINYDRNPNLTTDQKLQSLIENVQKAFDETMQELDSLKKEIQKLNERTE
jgi:peptidoglycan hydrolase CwlO-like protein